MSMTAIILVGIGLLVALSAIIAPLFLSTPPNYLRLVIRLTIIILWVNTGAMLMAYAATGNLLVVYIQYTGPLTAFALITVFANAILSPLCRTRPRPYEPTAVNHFTYAP